MDLRYVADTSSKQLFAAARCRQKIGALWLSTQLAVQHRCLHSMIEKWCGICVLYSLQCGCCVPNLGETSLSHFSRQSLQQAVLSSNFGGDVNNTNGATTEPTNHLPHKQKTKQSTKQKSEHTTEKEQKINFGRDVTNISGATPQPTRQLPHKQKNKQTNNGTNNEKQPNLEEMSTTPTERPPT